MKRHVLLLTAALLLAPMAANAQVPVTAATAAEQQAMLKSPDATLARNKKLVYDMWRTILVAGDASKAPEFLTEDYIQHNPTVATGREPFMRFFGGRPARPVPETIDNLVAIIAEGDLVTMAFRREMADPANPGQTYTTTWFDMFRIRNGKVGEHWDYGTKSAGRAGAGGPPPAAPGRSQ